MATIYVDGKEYEVNGADNLLQACLSLGLDIPYFCWHPALGSVGACRQCAVKEFKGADDKRGRLVMSCMTGISDGAHISIEDEEAKQFRASVIEWMMMNHPHDCPVCAEGGNCHLQDMTVMTGHSLRKYRFNKRTHNNQYLGPFIGHEMNRCIACYRCVRYYKDYADGTDLGVFGAHSNVYFGRVEPGVLESEFSGNLVEVCPTGVFTDKTHTARYNRKWDMQFAPSICQQCSVGCNTSPGERYGELRRIENRYNGAVNRYFLCDRGRFGYGYVNLPDRPRKPQQRRGDNWIDLNQEQALQAAHDILRQAKRVIGIGSPRASIESNYALRTLVGAENYSTGIEAQEQERILSILHILHQGGIHTPSLHEIEQYDAVLILGEDITQTAARIALAVRQAVKGKAQEMAHANKVADWQIAAVQTIGQNAKYPLFVTHVDATRLDDIAAWSYSAPVCDQARLGFAIAHELDSNAPAVTDLPAGLLHQAKTVAQALAEAKRPLIISGSNAGDQAVIEAAANIAKALQQLQRQVGISLVEAEANSLGVTMIGGHTLDDALTLLQSGAADGVIFLENDPYHRLSEAQIDQALANVAHIIVVDHQNHRLLKKADLILSAASFAESDGTLVNQEGRAQRYFQVYDPAYYDDPARSKLSIILDSWRWLHALDSMRRDSEIDWSMLDHVIADCVRALPQLAGITTAALDSSFRVHGQRIARSPHRYSGRTAMHANISVHEPRQPQDQDTAFAYSMEGYSGSDVATALIPFAWAPGWNSPQAWNKFQTEVGGSLAGGDSGVRLLEATGTGLPYFSAIPASFSVRTGIWQVAPYHALFGSDELSQRSEVMQQRMATPAIVLNRQEALQMGLIEGSLLEFSCAGQTYRLPVSLSERLSSGLAGLPIGLPGIATQLIGRVISNLQEVNK